MSQSQWAGLVTNASPYVIPPGAAVEQTNLSTAIPGQLTSRGGMAPVVFDEDESPAPEDVRDLHPYATATSRAMLALTSEGDVVLMRSPAFGSPPDAPEAPELEPEEGCVSSSYAGEFVPGSGVAT